MNEELDLAAVLEKLRWLRLAGMAQALPGLLERARKDNLTPLQIADALAEYEKTHQERRRTSHPRRTFRRDQHRRWL
jgi:hypothetical protein